MSPKVFFDEQAEQSLVKATIVHKYFRAWARVIIRWAKQRGDRIAYIDLFAGPGRYRDGAKSTPILILEQATQDNDLREMLVTIFNDVDEGHVRSLQEAIQSIPDIGTLKHKPLVLHEQVGSEIVQRLEQLHLVPTLFFVDPWGYKGLSLRLINSVLKDWGCDCIIFFNYNRINMGLDNDMVAAHMDALFGAQRAGELRARLMLLAPDEREIAIVEAIAEALQEMGGRYVLPFRFRSASGARTSHHLIFVTKHVRGYEIMKEIMAKESSSAQQGVASFEYNPATRSQPLLFDLARPLDDLAEMLLDEFAGRRMTVADVYNAHHVGRRYIKANYKDILVQLESEGRIAVSPPAAQRLKRKGKPTMAETVTITFPPRGRR